MISVKIYMTYAKSCETQNRKAFVQTLLKAFGHIKTELTYQLAALPQPGALVFTTYNILHNASHTNAVHGNSVKMSP